MRTLIGILIAAILVALLVLAMTVCPVCFLDGA